MNKIIFIADFFVEEVAGGGELNNDELVNLLRERGHEVIKYKSRAIKPSLLNAFDANTKFIISNFIQLPEESKRIFETNKNYVIYEHDHKYVKTRNPADYKDFIAPKEEIINYDFYKNAMAVLCQSNFHASIVKKNLNLENIISLSGNLWTEKSLNLMNEISQKEKQPRCSIMQSTNWHKNTDGAIAVCKKQNWEYTLIPYSGYENFLNQLGENGKFVFLPKTPETLSRIVVEARMMGMSVITNKLVGATREDWFSLKGEDLIELMVNKRQEIPKTLEEILLNE
tara:strand:+ start:4895 stop:5746 length:852 start_codon:yes stop_codon:yes gene_type:complete